MANHDVDKTFLLHGGKVSVFELHFVNHAISEACDCLHCDEHGWSKREGLIARAGGTFVGVCQQFYNVSLDCVG